MFFDYIIRNNPSAKPQVNRALLWEYDLPSFDWTAMRRIVVQRVIERGSEEDFLAIFSLYGGVEGVRKIVRDEVLWLSPKDLSFAYKIFGLKKEEMKCYTRAQLRAKHLNC